MKKLIALVLALVMMFTLVLSGCSNVETTAQPPKTTAAPQQTTSGSGDKETEPPETEPVVLNVWVQNSSRVTDYNDNKMTTWLEEHGNFDLRITSIPSADFVTKINMALTVGAVEELPDVIIGNNKSMLASSVMEWADAGSIIPLTEYYKDPKLAKNINESIERIGANYPSQLYMPDGEIYTFGNFNQSYGDEYPAKTWIYKPWLDALNMDIPKTTEDFYKVLKAVSETDLNGNGKHDEIPYAGAAATYTNYIPFLMNAFTYAGDGDGVYKIVEDGVVSSAVTTEEFKEGLKYIRQLFQEKLILNESLTMVKDQFEVLVNTEEHTVFAFTFSSPSIITNVEDIASNYIAIEPLVGPEGVQYASYKQTAPDSRMIITANCKNPEAAFKLGDLLSTEYIGITQRWGEQGVNWDYTADAKDAQNWECAFENFPLYIIAYDDNSFWGLKEPTNVSWMQTGIVVRGFYVSNGRGVPKGSVSAYTQHVNEAQKLYWEGGYAPDETIAMLTYNEDEGIVVSETQSTLKSYIQEYIGAVMMGNKNLEGDWDAFQAELEKIGLSDYLAAVQSAYDRMYK